MSRPSMSPIAVFIAHAPDDADLCDRLESHLSLMTRQGIISLWHDRRLSPGEVREQRIREELERSQVILLLVTASCLASDHCWEIVERAIARQQSGAALVVPIIARPCNWEDAPFGNLSVLPDNQQAVTSWSDRSEAWLNVVQGIRACIASLPMPESKRDRQVLNSNRESDTPTQEPERNVTLDPQTIARLTALLRPHMRSPQERQAYLVQAFGTNSPLLDRLELTGAVDTFLTAELIPKLQDFGEIEPGKPAIVALLEVIRKQVGIDKQAQIDSLMPDLLEVFRNHANAYIDSVIDDMRGDRGSRSQPKPTAPPASQENEPVREIFISYSWRGESGELADRLDAAFQNRGITIVRDKRDAGYKASIKDFMRRIGSGKAVIVVISDRYLKSENCMFELLEIAKHGEFRDRIFPIVLKDANIYKPVPRLQYVKYWETQIDELDAAIKEVSAAHLQGFREAIDLYTNIRTTIAELVDILADTNALTPEMHQESDFEQLLEAISALVSPGLE